MDGDPLQAPNQFQVARAVLLPALLKPLKLEKQPEVIWGFRFRRTKVRAERRSG